MKPRPFRPLRSRSAFTLLEVIVSMSVFSVVMGMCMSTFVFGLRAMYKDCQRLETNANLRSFMAQMSKETLDSSYFYLFPYYTALNGSVDLVNGPSSMVQIQDAADNDYDKWVAQGDCLVLVTKSSQYRTTDIRQIRIYYRLVVNQAQRNQQAPIRYYETADWGEGTAALSNGHTDIQAELNQIRLSTSPTGSGTRQISAKTIGRLVAAPYTPYVAGDRYPVFSSESPDASVTNGFVAINMEMINGTSANNLLSSSSFNYTVSPRR